MKKRIVFLGLCLINILLQTNCQTIDQEKLLQDLQDPELASAYLNIALMDEDPRIFLVALKCL